jgi:Xaa-Pro aminopeptidase
LEGVRYLYIDTGAEVEHYAADITRTYFLKPPNKRERAVYQAVKDVHDYALSHLKPGITLRESEDNVSHYMGEKLRELGLIKTVDKEHIKRYFGHLCSHFLGLDVHDVGDYDRPLQPGMVLTVEPGIYIKPEGLGVRIEDDVLITEKGCKVLSAKLK